MQRHLLGRLLDDGESLSALVSITASSGTGKTAFLQDWCRKEPRTRVYLEARSSRERRLSWLDRLDEVSQLDSSVTIVLDGVEAISAPSARERLKETVTAGTGPIVLSGRTQPLELTTVAAARPFITVGLGELAFGAREAHALLRSAGVTLSRETLLDLLDRVGGRALTLSLAAAVLGRSDNPEDAVRRLVHAPGDSDEQLAIALLDAFTSTDQDALLALAAVPQFDMNLAVELTGRPDVGAVIQRLDLGPRLLQRHHQSIEEPTGAHETYTFEDFFRRALLAEQDRRNPIRRKSIHRAASRWFVANGDLEAGIEQAVRTGSSELVGHLLKQYGLGLIFRGETRAVRAALEALEERETLTPTTALLWALLTAPFPSGSVRVEHFLALAAEETGTAPERAVVLAGLQVLRAPLGASLDAALAALEEAVQRTSENPRGECGPVAVLDARLFGEVSRAAAQLRCGDADQALESALASATAADQSGRSWLTLVALEVAVDAACALGRWPLGKVLQRRISKLAPDNAMPDNIVEASALLRTASAAYQSCEAFRSSRLVDIVQAQWSGLNSGAVIVPKALLALFHLDDGHNVRAAFEELDSLFATRVKRHPFTFSMGLFRYLDLVLRYRGREDAKQRLSVLETVVGPGTIEVLLAKAIVAEGRPAQVGAEEALAQALRVGLPAWHGSNLVFSWLLLALWAEESERALLASERLTEAVALASRMGIRRPFLARGGRFARLVESRLGAFGADEEFAVSIVDALRTSPGELRATDEAVRLTTRETVLLKELPLHQSVARIADKHQVSVNTVKTQLRSLYAKLEASDRASAVDAARKIGLL